MGNGMPWRVSAILWACVALASVGGAYPTSAKANPAAPAPSHSVTLSWLPVKTKARLVGYNVYRADKSGGPYKLLNRLPVNRTRVIDDRVKAGQTYYYVVTTVDWQAGEGPKSQEISATVPK
jgi:fibronectin type 3 domain-containing protein